jgi:hypothetical protein
MINMPVWHVSSVALPLGYLSHCITLVQFVSICRLHVVVSFCRLCAFCVAFVRYVSPSCNLYRLHAICVTFMWFVSPSYDLYHLCVICITFVLFVSLVCKIRCQGRVSEWMVSFSSEGFWLPPQIRVGVGLRCKIGFAAKPPSGDVVVQ